MSSPIYPSLSSTYPVYHHLRSTTTLHASHRGARYQQYTENTFAAYDYAVLQCQTDILEIDLCLTKDATVVLKHDRLFSQNGNSHDVQYLTLNQLNKIHDKPFSTMSGETVSDVSDPHQFVTLEALLQRVRDQYDQQRRGRPIVLFCDFKMAEAVRPTTTLLEQYNMVDRVIYGAVDGEVNAAARQHRPNGSVPVCADVQTMRAIANQLKQDKTLDNVNFVHDIVGFFIEGSTADLITADLVRQFHSANKPIFCVGELCDDETKQKELIKLGIDCLFVDNPALLQKTLSVDQSPSTSQHANGGARQQSENKFKTFLRQFNSVDSIDMSKTSVDDIQFSLPGLDDRASSEPTLSLFNSKDDTYLYGMLLTQALKQFTGPITIIDNGCGSCIPTLMALVTTKRRDVRVIGVDIDGDALQVSKLNATKYNVVDQYTFIESSMDAFLDNFKFDTTTHYLMSTNPPYIATPDLSNVDRFWLPIDGGVTGDKFLKLVIDRPYPTNVSLCIMWTSLSNPMQCIDWFEKTYDIVYNFSAVVPFGKYTSHDLLNPYLVEERDKGIVVFDGDRVENMTHTIVGTLLTHKKSKS